jgi:hypothetical protein
MLEQAEKALHQSVNLTSQLLTFSKGGKPIKKVLAMRPVIENAVKFALSGSRIGFSLSIEDDLLTVEADEGQMTQVLQNIVLNAEQAMPLGGKVSIVARNVPVTGALPGGEQGSVEIRSRTRASACRRSTCRVSDPISRPGEGAGWGSPRPSPSSRTTAARSPCHRTWAWIHVHIRLPASGALLNGLRRRGSIPGGGRMLVMDDEKVVGM